MTDFLKEKLPIMYKIERNRLTKERRYDIIKKKLCCPLLLGFPLLPKSRFLTTYYVFEESRQ